MKTYKGRLPFPTTFITMSEMLTRVQGLEARLYDTAFDAETNPKSDEAVARWEKAFQLKEFLRFSTGDDVSYETLHKMPPEMELLGIAEDFHVISRAQAASLRKAYAEKIGEIVGVSITSDQLGVLQRFFKQEKLFPASASVEVPVRPSLVEKSKDAQGPAATLA